MRPKPQNKPTQNCLIALISISQLKREFQDFQSQVLEDMNRVVRQSMEDIISLWKFTSHSSQRKLTHRDRSSQQLKAAFDMIGEKQDLLQDIENRLVEAQQSKEELLSILQRQTELCTQLRSEQEEGVAKFHRKIDSLQGVIEDKDLMIADLMTESTILKRLLKEQYQSRQSTPMPLKEYSTNPKFTQARDSTFLKKISLNRQSELTPFSQSLSRLDFPKSSKPRQSSTSSSKLLKSVRVSESSNSVKSHIQKIIQKAVKQNYKKQRH